MATSQELIDELQKQIDLAYIVKHYAQEQLKITVQALDWIAGFSTDKNAANVAKDTLKKINTGSET
jgi:hypothetical protein